MATTIKLKNGSGAPTAGQLVQGEPALDLVNKRLYTEDSGGTVIEVGTNPTSLTVNGATTIEATTPVLLLSSPEQTWSGGENLGGVDWYTRDTSGVAPATVASITTLSSGSNTLPVTDMYFKTSPADATPKNRMLISGIGDISFYEDTGTTAKFFWDASAESLGIGTSSPSGKVHIETASSGATAGGGGDELVVENSSTAGISILSGTANDGNILFGDSGNSAAGYVQYKHGNDALAFGTSAAERMRIDSSGNLLVGTTDANLHTTTTEQGSRIGDGNVITSGNGTCAYFNRITTDGTIVDLRKDGTTVGSIGSYAGTYPYLASTTVGLLCGVSDVNPCTSTGAVADGTVSLGNSGRRFKDLYLSGGVYLGGTGAANHLDDYEEGTWTPTFTGSASNPTCTYASQNGTYTKVGNLVTAHCYIQTSSISGGGGNLQISGLPFAISTADRGRAALIAYQIATGPEATIQATSGSSSSVNILRRSNTTIASAWSYTQVSDADTGLAALAFTFTYQV